jgi:hypothetical protein
MKACAIAMGARAARVDHALGNPLMVETDDLLAEDEVLEERRPSVACFQRVLIIVDPQSLVRREVLAIRAHAKLVERLLLRARACSLGSSRILPGFALRHFVSFLSLSRLGHPSPIQGLCQAAPAGRGP